MSTVWAADAARNTPTRTRVDRQLDALFGVIRVIDLLATAQPVVGQLSLMIAGTGSRAEYRSWLRVSPVAQALNAFR